MWGPFNECIENIMYKIRENISSIIDIIVDLLMHVIYTFISIYDTTTQRC